MSTSPGLRGLMVALTVGALATGCRSLENAGHSLDTGLRDTQQDLQHGIRGEPDPGAPPPAAAPSAQPQRAAAPPPAPAPAPAPAPPPAPASNGTSL